MKLHLTLPLLMGFALCGCQEVSSEASASSELAVAETPSSTSNSHVAPANINDHPEMVGVITCTGDMQVTSSGPVQPRSETIKSAMILRIRRASQNPVELFIPQEKRFEPLCSFSDDCQFTGNSDNFVARGGFRKAEQAVSAMGASIDLLEMDYSDGKLLYESRSQKMTNYGPVENRTFGESKCVKGIVT